MHVCMYDDRAVKFYTQLTSDKCNKIYTQGNP